VVSHIFILSTTMLSIDGTRCTALQKNKKSLPNAKGNAQQQCMCEGPPWTKSELTNRSNDVSLTLARGRDWSHAATLAKNC